MLSNRRKRLPPAPDDAMLRAALRRTHALHGPDTDTVAPGRGAACVQTPGVPQGTPLCGPSSRDVPLVLCWDDC